MEEKESLLKEVHHRVKNNLQLISSLLNLQAGKQSDARVAELFLDSRNRVRSMALVHENLYRAGSFARIQMASHIRTLCYHLARAYGTGDDRVSVEVNIEDVELDLDRALSCGLIVNELFSNALKHAFPGDRSGTISVRLYASGPGSLTLAVADDGIGLAKGWEAIGSLGLQLVQDLVDQLRGRLDMTTDNGTTFMITFNGNSSGGRQ